MAVVADKARFRLERTVPDLLELERKEIFRRDEITAIVRRRSEFEHKINARGCTATDYRRYIDFESNLEALCRCRNKRLGLKYHPKSGQQRIKSLLQRATAKFHGDADLWLQYLTFARKQKAHKMVAEILTQALRLRPTEPELWIYAADYALQERGDIVDARSYMQRGIRMCRTHPRVWVQYFRLEMINIWKISTRAAVLGIEDDNTHLEDCAIDLQPVLSGAIPITIFDQAMKNVENVSQCAQSMFDVLEEFSSIACSRKVAKHIAGFLEMSTHTNHGLATLIYMKAQVMGLKLHSVDFPMALGWSFAHLEKHLDTFQEPQDISSLCIEACHWLLAIRQTPSLSSELHEAIGLMMTQTLQRSSSETSSEKQQVISKLLLEAQTSGSPKRLESA